MDGVEKRIDGWRRVARWQPDRKAGKWEEEDFGSRGFGVRVPKGSWRFSQFCILPHGAKVPRRPTSFAFLEAPLAKREGGRGLPRPSSGNPSKQNAATATVPGGPVN